MKHDICFNAAELKDNGGLKRLLKHSPMSGDIQLSYQREPDFFAASEIEGDVSQIVVAKAEDQIVGCFSHSQYQAYIDGLPQSVAYLGQLRSLPAYRHKIRYIKQGFETCRAIDQHSNADFSFTSIVSDNHTAKRLLNAGLKTLPEYKPLADISTLAIPVKPVKPSENVRPASEKDIPSIVAFLNSENSRYQLAPVWHEEDFNSKRTRGLSPNDFLLFYENDQLVGCLAVWDQSSFKQYVIAGYAKKIERWRWLNNLTTKFMGGIHLPAIDEPLHYAFLSHLAVKDDSPEVMQLLMKAALAQARKKEISVLLLGMDTRRSLCTSIKGSFNYLEYKSTVYSVKWDKKRPDHATENNRLFHPEIAIM